MTVISSQPTQKTEEDYESIESSLRILEFGDKAVCDDQVYNGVERVIRRPFVDDIVGDIQEALKDASIKDVGIYADTVQLRRNRPTLKSDRVVTIAIYARDAFSRAAENEFLGFELPEGSYINFFTQSLPSTFQVRINGTYYKPTFTSEKSGVRIAIKAGAITETQRDPGRLELKSRRYWEAINEDGTVNTDWENRIKNNQLGRLLEFQLILATSWSFSDPKTCLSLTSYILAISNANPQSCFDIRSKAATLASRISVGGNSLIPALDLSATKVMLDSRLSVANQFEEAFRYFSTKGFVAESFRQMATVILERSKDAQAQYTAVKIISQERYNAALASLDTARESFKTHEATIKGKGEVFKKGLEKWKDDETNKAVFEVIMSVVSIGTSLAAMLVTPTAAAGAAGAAAKTADAVKNATEVASKFAKVVEIMKKVGEIVEKLAGITEKIKKIIDTVKELTEKSKSVDNGDVGLVNLPKDISSDLINGSADWDVFAIKAFGIDGSGEYFLALQILPIRGKAILAAESAFTHAGDDLTRVLLQKGIHDKDTTRFEKIVAKMGAPNNAHAPAFELMKWAMFDEVMALRGWISIDIQAYLANYMYFSLSKESPVDMGSNKSVAEFYRDAATLQDAVHKAQVQMRPQKKKFTISTAKNGSLIFPNNWKSILETSRSLQVNIDTRVEVFKGYARVRVNELLVWLDGVSGTSLVKIDISNITGQLQDINFRRPYQAIAFTVEPTSRRFEYDIGSMAIEMHGSYVNEQANFLKPTPFTIWEIEVPEEYNTINLSSVTGIRLEFDCEVIPIRGA
ncbi:hypothetical protein H072_2848 [Dactylellina haptotyla CBS 200.50]|uniref:Uncharacterized protein n=1 Tax=Dactylellina haptotyla (strain CBS 200.50) TaxID=1284197 RepID=S8APR8_DACHA|nr:hypothetical protein H072_2848 [Dactylellina haptotyla CBS 200.50]